MVGLMDEQGWKRTVPYVEALAVFLLLGVLLFPQGVGLLLASGLPKLDLPRMAMLALFALALVYLPLARKHLDWRVAPRTTIVLVLIIVWQLISGMVSSGGTWSLLWAVSNIISYWGFALLFLLLAGRPDARPMVSRLLTVAAMLLTAWSCIEFLTQQKLFPYRNLYVADPTSLFSPTMRRRVVVDGVEIGPLPLMSLGPFFTNLILGAVLCALSGFLLIGSEQRRPLWFGLGAGLVVFSVLAVQSRACLVALVVMLCVALFQQRTRQIRVATVVGIVIASGLFVGIFGVTDVARSFGYQLVSHNSVGARSEVQAAPSVRPLPSPQQATGSLQTRLSGLSELTEQVSASHAWLFGVGPGALFDANRVKTTLTFLSDQGSFFAFTIESGIVMGLLLTFLLGASFVQGVRSPSPVVRAATLGLGGFCLTALVSIVPHGWTIALVLAGLIESWSRAVESTS